MCGARRKQWHARLAHMLRGSARNLYGRGEEEFAESGFASD